MPISGLSPTSGKRGDLVTISGTGFGARQSLATPAGPATVTFHSADHPVRTVPAIPASWSNERIVVPVPDGATTGDIIVTVAGETSRWPFTVL